LINMFSMLVTTAAPMITSAAVSSAVSMLTPAELLFVFVYDKKFQLIIAAENRREAFKKFIYADYANNTAHFYDLYMLKRQTMVLSKADHDFMKIVITGTNTPEYKKNIDANINNYINYLDGIANTNNFHVYKFGADDIIR